MDFLKKNGKLDEFIEAKLLGKDEVAKWLLLDTAGPEISKIEKKHKDKEDQIAALELEQNKNSQTSRKQFFLTTSYTGGFNKFSSIKDITFAPVADSLLQTADVSLSSNTKFMMSRT